jgi:hypothetical protein
MTEASNQESGSYESAIRAEMDALVADIRESHADIDAGRVATVGETFAEVRRQIATLRTNDWR